MASIDLSVDAPDTCSVACKVTGVTGTDGAGASDMAITGDMSVSLRSDRTGRDKNGRVYTMQLACTDPVTNLSGTKTTTVTVPHDQRGN